MITTARTKMTAEREMDLILRAQKMDRKALGLLCTDNECVSYLVNLYKNPKVEMCDLEGAAMEGLIKAIYKFDPKANCRLNTFACSYIKAAIFDALSQYCQPVKQPKEINDARKAVAKARKAFYKMYGTDPDEYDLADFMGIELEQLLEMSNTGKVTFCDFYTDELMNEQAGYIFKTNLYEESADSEILQEQRQQFGVEFLKKLLTENEFKVLQMVECAVTPDKSIAIKKVAKDLGFTDRKTYHLWENARQKLKKHLAEFEKAA